MSKVLKGLLYALLIILSILSIFPFWILFVNATRASDQITQVFSLMPSNFLFKNFDSLLSQGFDVYSGFRNSIFISTTTTILSLYFSALTAYGFKVYNFKFKRYLYVVIILSILIPPQLSIIGFYQLMVKMGLTNSYIPLIVPMIAAPATVFFFRQYLDSILHKELIEAARIDGANELYVFHKIVMPLIQPALATMGIFTFVVSWNDFFTPLMIITSKSKYTLPMLIALLRGEVYMVDYGAMYLGLSLSVIPLIIIYMLFSKYIIDGTTLGSVKG